MRRDVIRDALGRAAAALAFGLAATAACSDELTEPPVEVAPAAADGFATIAGDRAALVALYEATGGSNWARNDKWLTRAPLNAWHGVGTDASGRVRLLDLYDNGLTGEIPPELGNLASLEYLLLGNNGLTGEIPPELGNLPNLSSLTLNDNRLTGEIPAKLGALANLRILLLGGNDLTGVIPPTFSNLPNLKWFHWNKNAGLCAPGTRRFISFAESLDEQTGSFCHEADAVLLRSVYHSTRGADWTSADGWLQPGPLADWHGVETDSVSGRVSGLDLSRNGLSGELLGNLASLDLLRELRLDGNGQLGGRLRSGMTDLPLRILSYDGTNLCTPADPAFRMWLRSIPMHSGTGTECPPLTDRDVLEILFESTGGRSWPRHSNWLTDAPLDEWRGVKTDASGRVRELYLPNDGLTGEIPPELGNLASLERLELDYNALTGEIPPELGNLANLEGLELHDNALTGEIPPELGNLASLEWLWLSDNGLTGEIPPELGNLANLERLSLSNNGLTGEIPPELGNLANLGYLSLANNPDLFGALPVVNLIKLWELIVRGTELCVLDDFAVQLWLRSIYLRERQPLSYLYVPVCKAQAGTVTATAYIVQAVQVQSANFAVPLVAGRPGLLRVLVAAPDAGGAPIPSGWATFYQRDGSKHSVRVSPGDGTIPAEAEAAESSLSLSANAKVPGDVLRPGAEMVVVLDPEGALDPALGVPQRIPAAGRTALDVYEMPAFDVTVVPFLFEPEPDSSILDVTNGMTAEDSLFEETRRLLPVGPMSVTVHEPVWTSTRSAFDLLDQTRAIRRMEGGAGYYMGTLPNPTGGAAGVAYLRGKDSFSVPHGEVIAHEFGHNMNLSHAPCGGPDFLDFRYPHAGGVAGAWGWDRRSGRLVSPVIPDIMSYCHPRDMISDYHFAKALRWWRRRLGDEAGVGAYYAGPLTQALLLWGGVGADGAPFLNPAFVFDGRPSLLDGAGAWRIVGEGGDGRVLFSQRFEMAETVDGDGRSSFALALAADSNWADALSRIVLTGPDGSVAMNAGTGPAAALLRDPATGRVRGILHDWPGSAAGAQPDAGRALPERGLEVQVSVGIPRSDAWHR